MGRVESACHGSLRKDGLRDQIAKPLVHSFSSMTADTIQAEAEALCITARWCSERGWVPATSGNFSVCDRLAHRMLISPSGIDKGSLTPVQLLDADMQGCVAENAIRPSAETALHVVLYRQRADAAAVLHVHTIWNTLISARYEDMGYVPIEGYELLKGLSGVKSHEHRECVPILKNSQDYAELSEGLSLALRQFPAGHGVLLSRHGLYTWGRSVAEARRHLEALEFLFEVEERRLGGSHRFD